MSERVAGIRTVGALPLACLLLLVVPSLHAQEDAAPAPAPADTVRTNVWLVEALMEDVVAAVARVLPPAPADILVVQQADKVEDELFAGVVFRQLTARGYTLYSPPQEEGEPDPAHDVRFAFRVAGVDLAYPDVGRTLGLWRRWVDRDVEVAAFVQVSESGSGRMLLSRRVSRGFRDRVPAGVFDDVESPLYPFTTAEVAESGWQRRIEEIVVLGALAGLVAVYFANTNN